MNELRSTDAKIREQAARRLGQQQDRRAVDELIQCLKDRAYQVQAAAAKALGQIGDERAVAPLINCLKGETYRLIDAEGSPGRYSEIVSSAAWALGRIGTTPARQALLERLESADHLQVAAAVVGFGQLRDEHAFEVLRDALAHRAHYVRLCAVRALGECGDSRAADLLLAALEDGVWIVELAAMEALGDLRDERASDHLLRCYQSVKETTVDFLSDPAWRMSIEDIRLQATAARGLARMAHSLSLLEQDFTAAPWPTRAIAAVGLAYHRDMRVFETLLQAVHDHKNPTLQVEAAKALVYLSEPAAIPALQAVVANRRVWVDEVNELLDDLEVGIAQPAGWIREQTRALFCGLIDGTVDVVTGCRRLTQLYHYGYTWISTLFVGLNSELDIVPPPETYHQWNPQALEQKLNEVQPILDAYRAQAQAEARKMLDDYFPGESCG